MDYPIVSPRHELGQHADALPSDGVPILTIHEGFSSLTTRLPQVDEHPFIQCDEACRGGE